MAMNGPEQIIVVLLSLMFAITTYADYPYPPAPRINARLPTRNVTSENLSTTAIPKHLDTRSTMSKSRQQGMFDDGSIVYPEYSCEYGLCVNVANYPKDRIQSLVSRSEFATEYFRSSEDSIEIFNRFNSDEMTLCDTKLHTVYPQRANNTKKVEKVIVNAGENQQGIVFETCVNNGKCKFSSHFPTGYTSYCKQKYIRKKLMVLGDNDDKFTFDTFEVPSCCVCTLNRED